MNTNIATASPAEIDGELFRLFQIVWTLEDKQASKLDRLHQRVGDKKVYGWGRGERQGTWQLSADEVLAQASASLDPGTANDWDAYERLTVEIAATNEAIVPLNDQYLTRGGWTRAYLVDNADGHVHRNTRCSSWHRGVSATRYHWLTELSGHAESEIVELAGERACTLCYSSAPVDVLKRPSKLEGPAQAAAREAAAERAAEKAARDAKKAEKAITNPDGSPLKGKWGVIKTTVTAWNELVDDIFTHRAYNYSLNTTANAAIVSALAAKLGQTEAEILATVDTKVAAKAKREKVAL